MSHYIINELFWTDIYKYRNLHQGTSFIQNTPSTNPIVQYKRKQFLRFTNNVCNFLFQFDSTLKTINLVNEKKMLFYYLMKSSRFRLKIALLAP